MIGIASIRFASVAVPSVHDVILGCAAFVSLRIECFDHGTLHVEAPAAKRLDAAAVRHRPPAEPQVVVVGMRVEAAQQRAVP